MSDTITKWHEMEEEKKLAKNAEQYNKELNESQPKDYIWVLDFNDSKVYSYKVPSGVNDLESFIIGAGHKLSNVEWMNTNECSVEYGN
jgi:hypothetical protein